VLDVLARESQELEAQDGIRRFIATTEVKAVTQHLLQHKEELGNME
jgi:hypothetical protein